MRNVSRAILVLAGFLMLGSGKAHATEYPYCMSYVDGWSGTIERCDFTSMEQCRASATGLNGTCAPNWRIAQSRNESPDVVKKNRSRRDQRE